ncbi:hypothetical protein [Paenibacillus sp. GbtcB18]|nr:hypothetical protein [Paenibacillus sp. GbtcB18]
MQQVRRPASAAHTDYNQESARLSLSIPLSIRQLTASITVR